MWNAIPWVTSGLTLVAFLAAVAAWVVRLKILEKERLLRTAPEEKRAELVADAMEFFHVDTGRLTKQQQFELALQQIRARAQRFLLTTILVAIIALVTAVTAAVAMVRKPEPRPITHFQTIDAATGDDVQCTLTMHFVADNVPGRPVTVEAREHGLFDLSGIAEITDVSGFAGYEFLREEEPEIRDGRKLIKLQRTSDFVDAIKPTDFKVSVTARSYESALQAPGQPDPDQVKLTCQNDTKYTVDLFFYRYFPPGKRPKFLKDALTGPVTCPRKQETLVWDSFGTDPGGAFFFFASVGGAKARLITARTGDVNPAYVLRSLNPQLVLSDRDGWFTGEVKHEFSSTAQEVQ